DLLGGGRPVRVLEGLKQFLKFRHEQADPPFELQEIGVGTGERFDGRRGQRALEITVREDCLIAVFAEADVQGDGIVWKWLFCHREVSVSCQRQISIRVEWRWKSRRTSSDI